VEPDELIFKEDVSAVLKDSNGSKITKWENRKQRLAYLGLTAKK
jgi:hypothetical protein